jgi:hypothetical protein
MRALAIGLAVWAAGCGDDIQFQFGPLVQVSGDTPFFGGCNGPVQSGANFPSMEVEPMVAADPADASRLVGVWQQDRWNTGGSNGILAATSKDGGETWTRSRAHFSHCTGGTPANGGDYERASDPWVSIGPSGTVWQSALAFDGTLPRSAIVAARSDDGGVTWSDPVALQADDDGDIVNDKDSVTADPTDAGRVFVVWERLTGQSMPMAPIAHGPAMLARAEGGVWEPARAIYDPGADQQTLGNIVLVEPDGTVVDVFQHLTGISTADPFPDIEVIRSSDHGTTWSAPTMIAPQAWYGVLDANPQVYVRTFGLPMAAVDPTSGELYVAWEQAFPPIDGIVLTTSTDGGATWSPPAQVNQQRAAQAFLPSLAVAGHGTVAVSYYDTRDAGVGSIDQFDVAAFLITSHDHGATWTEERLTAPFDLRQASIGDQYFLGDYQGLTAAGGAFVPFFVAAVTAPSDPTDVFVRPL